MNRYHVRILTLRDKVQPINNLVLGILLLSLGQILRGIATRRFLFGFAPLRHRLIFAINGFGSTANLLLPFRLGDFIRIWMYSRNKLSLNVAILFIVVERITDLILINSLILMSSLFIPAVTAHQINVFSLILGTLFLGLIYFAYDRNNLGNNIKSPFLSVVLHFRVVLSLKKYKTFFTLILCNWILTFMAIYIIASDSKQIFLAWIEFNTKFGDPFKFIFSRNELLVLTLFVPIIGAWIYSLYFPTPMRVARYALKKYAVNGKLILNLEIKKSDYSGSGDSLFTAKIKNTDGSANNVFIKVSTNGLLHELKNTEIFLINNKLNYNFPSVLDSGVYRGNYYLITELITDSTTEKTAFNCSEFLVDRSLSEKEIILHQLIRFLSRANKSVMLSKNDVVDSRNIKLITERLIRANSLAHLKLNLFNDKHQEILQEFNGLVLRLLSNLELNKHKILKGITHGDATLSNFLINSNNDSNFSFTSIDPNPRFGIGNLEFDLAKIMQSTHFGYENIEARKYYENNFFDSAKLTEQTPDLKSIFNTLIYEDEIIENINTNILLMFFITHLVRLIPYKINQNQDYFLSLLEHIIFVEQDVYNR